MAEERGLMNDFVARDFFAASPHIEDHFDYVFDVALRVDTTWNGKTHKVHGGVFSEHQRAYFDGTDATFEIEFIGERDTRQLRERNMRQKCASVEINGVAAGRLNDGNTFTGNVIPQEGR